MEILDWKPSGEVLKFRMRMPMDGHQHLREGPLLRYVAPLVAKRFHSAIVMPNLVPPITTEQMAADYRHKILSATGPVGFYPLVTLYLTDTLEPTQVALGLGRSTVYGVKYYPPGLTTNSDSGVENPASLWTKRTKPYQCLRTLAEHGGVFLIHAADGKTSALWHREGHRNYYAGEDLDPYDQEPHFICESLPRIIDAHPELKISVEHLSTAVGAQFVRANGNEKLGCSLTAQHLLHDRRDSFKKGKKVGFNPHLFWWPVIQSKEHRDELRKLACEDKPFVWLRSDSAPHPISKKENDCCSGGVLMAHGGIEFYAEAFEGMQCLDDRFERFASLNGPRFFGLKLSDRTIELVREEWKVEDFFCYDVGDDIAANGGDRYMRPFRFGETVRWKLVG